MAWGWSDMWFFAGVSCGVLCHKGARARARWASSRRTRHCRHSSESWNPVVGVKGISSGDINRFFAGPAPHAGYFLVATRSNQRNALPVASPAFGRFPALLAKAGRCATRPTCPLASWTQTVLAHTPGFSSGTRRAPTGERQSRGLYPVVAPATNTDHNLAHVFLTDTLVCRLGFQRSFLPFCLCQSLRVPQQ